MSSPFDPPQIQNARHILLADINKYDLFRCFRLISKNIFAVPERDCSDENEREKTLRDKSRIYFKNTNNTDSSKLFRIFFYVLEISLENRIDLF